MEFVRHFVLPLLGELRRAQDCQTADLSTIQQFPDDEQRLHGFADAHVIGNEEADNGLAHGHEQGHELVGTGINRNMAEGTEGTCGGPEAETHGIAKQPAGTRIAGTGRIGQGKTCRLDVSQIR